MLSLTSKTRHALPVKPVTAKAGLFAGTGNDTESHYEIQRCDVCEQFDSDIAAIEPVEKAAKAYPELLKFVEEVSDLTHERELGQEGKPDDRPSEDFISTL